MITLAGYKTYICAGVGAIITCVYMIGLIDISAWQAGMAICGFGGMASLRASVKKV